MWRVYVFPGTWGSLGTMGWDAGSVFLSVIFEGWEGVSDGTKSFVLVEASRVHLVIVNQ